MFGNVDASTRARDILTPNLQRYAIRLFVDDCCANCLRPLPRETAGLFCSSWCRETTKDVRYFRRAFRDGRVNDPDVQSAIKTRMAFLLSGGYSALGRTLSPATRAAVKERDHDLCQSCGSPGTEIDHISGSSPDVSNLQLLCHGCHGAKTEAAMRPADIESQDLGRALMHDRVHVTDPVLLADDETAWDGQWRGLVRARGARIRQLPTATSSQPGVNQTTDHG